MDIEPPHQHQLTLAILDGEFAVCQLSPTSGLPAWAYGGTFWSITRTLDEVSIVCPASSVPGAIKAERGWRVLRVVGTQEFALVGVLASLVDPLARAGISLFALATYDTDYLLIKAESLPQAMAALQAAGHAVPDQVTKRA